MKWALVISIVAVLICLIVAFSVAVVIGAIAEHRYWELHQADDLTTAEMEEMKQLEYFLGYGDKE